MTLWTLGGLEAGPAAARPELLADPVRALLDGWGRAGDVGVVEIDPDQADTVT